MTILLVNNHTPYNAMLAEALWDCEIHCREWDCLLRDVPENVAVTSLPLKRYDAIITDGFDLRAFDFPATRRVFIQHCECCHTEGPEFERWRNVFWRSDKVVSVSGHKQATLREFSLNPKSTVINFGFSTATWNRKNQWQEGLIGCVWNGLATNPEALEVWRQVCEGFNAVVIGHGNEGIDFCPVIRPETESEYHREAEKLNVLVHPMAGNQCGMAPMELMMLGTPVVSGSVAELWEFCHDGWNIALSRDRGDKAVEFMRQWAYHLCNTQPAARAMGSAGSFTVAKHRSLRRLRNKWLEVLKA